MMAIIGESDSISNQRILTRGYLDGKSEFVIVREFVDDGYTGTNFDRPDFQKMMEFLEEGKADCIVCKDLSRFGRDFSGVLQYVERILPQMGIRLILVNDNYDSNFPNHDFITLRMKSLINDILPCGHIQKCACKSARKNDGWTEYCSICILWLSEIT